MGALPAPIQRLLTFLVPVAALCVCAAVVLPRQARLRETDRQIAATRVEIRRYIAQIESIRNLPPDPMIASLPETKQEQTTFLRGVTALCARTGNHITSVQSLAPSEPPKDAPNAKKTPSPDDLPADVTAIKSTITFVGDFRSLQKFLGGLTHTRRLISLTDCRVECSERCYPKLTTTVSLTRYVDNGAAAATAPPAPATAANPPSRAPG